jgi:hypothetical protein
MQYFGDAVRFPKFFCAPAQSLSDLSVQQELAANVIKRVAALWQIDNDRSTFREDGFDWWPGHFWVRFRVAQEKGRPDVRVSVRTDFLKNVPVSENRFVELAAVNSVLATSTYAWIYPPTDYWNHLNSNPKKETPKLQFSSTAYVTSETAGWLPDFIAGTTIVQPINADIQAKEMSKLFGGGEVDVSGPMVTSDVGFDQMIETLTLVYGPQGQQPSRWAGSAEFQEFSEKWGRSDVCFGLGDPSGLTLETPLGSGSILIRLHTAERHPQLGNGLLGTIQVPYFSDANKIAKLSAELNFLESWQWTNFPQNGCWHPVGGSQNQFGLAFSAFIPNALYRPVLATNLAIWLLARSRWVREQKWPDAKDETMLNILKKRVNVDTHQCS